MCHASQCVDLLVINTLLLSICVCRPPSKLAGADDGDEVLVLLLRLLRNCCALGAPAAAVLMQHKLHTILAATIAAMAASSAPTSCPAAGTQQLPGQSTPTNTQQLSDLLLPAAQMLCNLSSTGAQAAAGVWQALFTAALCSLLLAGDGEWQQQRLGWESAQAAATYVFMLTVGVILALQFNQVDQATAVLSCCAVLCRACA